MGRSPCCEKVGLKKGPWTPEEDQKLLAYIEEHGHGSWRALPGKAGLQRCGKSCRLRWTNYLRPDIKRGKFSLQEEQTIIQLHALLGNRWSAIATHLPKRTDNEIKNYWNTHLKKRLARMGIDPVTHKPKSDTLSSSVDGQCKNAANLSHMAQWESARLEAEARLVRESKLRSNSNSNSTSMIQPHLAASAPVLQTNTTAAPWAPPPPLLDVLKAWQGVWSKSTKGGLGGGIGGGVGDLESPTSTLSFSENALLIPTVGIGGENSAATNEFVGNLSLCRGGGGEVKEEAEEEDEEEEEEEEEEEDWKGFGMENSRDFSTTTGLGDLVFSGSPWSPESSRTTGDKTSGGVQGKKPDFIDGFTNLLLDKNNNNNNNNNDEQSSSSESENAEELENKNYWNNILELVNSSPSNINSPVF